MHGGGRNDTVAIRTTLPKLRASLQTADVRIERVHYIDYKTNPAFTNPFLDAFTHKRIQFRDESEVRVILQDLPITRTVDGQVMFNKDEQSAENVKFIQLNHGAQELITEIRLHPDAPPQLREAIIHLLNRIRIHIQVRDSELDVKPFN